MNSLKEKLKEQILSVKNAAVGRIVDKILSYATIENIDEIIIEFFEEEAKVNFYEAGEKKGGLSVSKKVEDDLFESLKEMAGIEENGKTGTFKKQTNGKKMIFFLEVRDSSPKKIIIKIHHNRFDLIDIGRLGFEKKSLLKIKAALEKKSGLIFDIGPFNSGKTSTLYSFINYINQSDLNITTLEKEISYDIPAINQSELCYKEGFSYPFPLSSLLRQDPDVIMMDEISDKEAIESALHLSDRGYLVLVGVYGVNFEGTFDFLSKLGVSLPLFCSNASIVINQRLVRRNCPHCLESVKIGADEEARIKEVVDIPKILRKMRKEKIIPAGADLKDLNIFRSLGCDKCCNSGFSGETGVFEVLEMTPAVKKEMLAGHFSTASAEIKSQDNFSLTEAAFAKLSLGIISLEEFLRIVS